MDIDVLMVTLGKIWLLFCNAFQIFECLVGMYRNYMHSFIMKWTIIPYLPLQYQHNVEWIIMAFIVPAITVWLVYRVVVIIMGKNNEGTIIQRPPPPSYPPPLSSNSAVADEKWAQGIERLERRLQEERAAVASVISNLPLPPAATPAPRKVASVAEVAPRAATSVKLARPARVVRRQLHVSPEPPARKRAENANDGDNNNTGTAKKSTSRGKKVPSREVQALLDMSANLGMTVSNPNAPRAASGRRRKE